MEKLLLKNLNNSGTIEMLKSMWIRKIESNKLEMRG